MLPNAAGLVFRLKVDSLLNNRFSDFTISKHLKRTNSETVPNSKKLWTTTEMLAIEGFSDLDCIENVVEKGEIAHFYHISESSKLN